MLGNIDVGYAADLVFVDPAIVSASADASSSINDLLYSFRPSKVMVGGCVVAGTTPTVLSPLPPFDDTATNTSLLSSTPVIVPSTPIVLQEGPFIPGKAGCIQRWKPSCACLLLGRSCDNIPFFDEFE